MKVTRTRSRCGSFCGASMLLKIKGDSARAFELAVTEYSNKSMGLSQEQAKRCQHFLRLSICKVFATRETTRT